MVVKNGGHTSFGCKHINTHTAKQGHRHCIGVLSYYKVYTVFLNMIVKFVGDNTSLRCNIFNYIVLVYIIDLNRVPVEVGECVFLVIFLEV